MLSSMTFRFVHAYLVLEVIIENYYRTKIKNYVNIRQILSQNMIIT